MKHNTIEVKLNSYGTLEVVTAPVKLYKDSYNVVKLRVNAPMVAESMLKVYLGDEDEAGEKVWTSNTYSWLVKETVVINGVPYNVYEEYLPQEFCSESGDIRITFAQVVGKDGVNQILTSGSLNLYVSGDGFNFNGVEIAESDKLAIKINEVLTYYKDYDLKIRSQAEFVSFYESLDNGTCTAHSVLFVGDGGSLVFTRQDGKGLKLPQTLYRLDGTNNAKIEVLNHTDSVSGAIRYNTKPTTDNYSISNLTVICRSVGDYSGMGIVNARNIINCVVSGYRLGSGLWNCDNIINTQAFGYGEVNAQTSSGFLECKNIVNCEASAESINGYAWSYYKCENIINSKAFAVTGFQECKNISNSHTYSTTGFRTCENISNCIINGTDTGFRDCFNISNNRFVSPNITRYVNCSLITATQETMMEYVDSKIGEVNTALSNINSGEGV